MKHQVLYPGTTNGHGVVQYVDGPVFDSLADTFKFLWDRFGDQSYGAYIHDGFGIPFKNKDNVTIAYVKRVD